MITREELLKSPEYWFENAQNDLYGHVVEYMAKEGINQNQLAERLGVTKGYVSQILKGEFNYTLKKLIELSIAIGKVPAIEYKTISDVLHEDKRTRHLHGETFGSASLDKLEFTTTGFNGKDFTPLTSTASNSALAAGKKTSIKETLPAGEYQYLKSAS